MCLSSLQQSMAFEVLYERECVKLLWYHSIIHETSNTADKNQLYHTGELVVGVCFIHLFLYVILHSSHIAFSTYNLLIDEHDESVIQLFKNFEIIFKNHLDSIKVYYTTL